MIARGQLTSRLECLSNGEARDRLTEYRLANGEIVSPVGKELKKLDGFFPWDFSHKSTMSADKTGPEGTGHNAASDSLSRVLICCSHG